MDRGQERDGEERVHSVYFSIFSLNVSISVARSVTFETSVANGQFFFTNVIMIDHFLISMHLFIFSIIYLTIENFFQLIIIK